MSCELDEELMIIILSKSLWDLKIYDKLCCYVDKKLPMSGNFQISDSNKKDKIVMIVSVKFTMNNFTFSYLEKWFVHVSSKMNVVISKCNLG